MASLIMLSLLLIVMLAFDVQPVEATTIYVPFDYPTIQEAINAASNGDTVVVAGMIWYESIVVNKSISVRGGGQFLDYVDVVADNASIIWFNVYRLHIAADNVSIRNLGQWSELSFPYGPGILLDVANNCSISE